MKENRAIRSYSFYHQKEKTKTPAGFALNILGVPLPVSRSAWIFYFNAP